MPGPDDAAAPEFHEIRIPVGRLPSVHLLCRDQPAYLWAHAGPEAPPPGELYLQVAPGPSVRRGKRPPAVLPFNAFEGFAVLREAVPRVMAGVPDTDVAWNPLALEDDRGRVDADYVIPDFKACFAVDRDAVAATFFDPANPHGSHLEGVRTFAWGPDRRPPARIFRPVEAPRLLVADRTLADALAEAAGGPVLVASPRPFPTRGLFSPPAYARASVRSFAPDAAGARDAAEAYWEQVRRRAADPACACDAVLRTRAVDNPLYALAWARTFDGGPRDDTRLAAARDPWLATAYAAGVDRGPHPVTRAGALAEATAAGAYAERVSCDLDAATEAVLLASGFWDAAALRKMHAILDPNRAWRAARPAGPARPGPEPR